MSPGQVHSFIDWFYHCLRLGHVSIDRHNSRNLVWHLREAQDTARILLLRDLGRTE